MTDADVLYNLSVEAHRRGVHYLGTDPRELARLLEMSDAARKDKPPCFLRSFSPTDQLCRACDLYVLCGEKTITPQWTLTPIEVLPCGLCDGDLHIALYNDQGTVVDYACSTPGCWQTLSKQQATHGG